MIVDNVRIQCESAHWIVLGLYKSTILVLPRSAFVEGLKRGKAWRRATAMRTRQPDAEAAADRRRRAREVLR